MRLIQFIFALILSQCFSIKAQNDLQLDSIFHRSNVGEFYSGGLEYHRMPSNQLRPIEFSGLVTNLGINDIMNCYLNVDVIFGSTTILSVQSDSVLIISSSQDSIFTNTSVDLMGQSLGKYTFVVSIQSDSSEINYQNNADSIQFEITENILSRSDFEILDSTKNYYHDSLDYRSFGYVFKVEQDACLSSIHPWVSFNQGNTS